MKTFIILAGTTRIAVPLLQALAKDFVSYAAEHYCAKCIGLWVRRTAGSGLELLTSMGREDEGPRSIRPLRVDDQDVGRVEMDVLTTDGRPWSALEALLPWLALGMQSCLRASDPGGARPRADRAHQVDLASARYGLTARERMVLELLLKGLSNKEFATALECSPRTIDIHVSNLLRKSVVQGRGELVANVVDIDR